MACADVATAKAKAATAINFIIDYLQCFSLELIMSCFAGTYLASRVLRPPRVRGLGAHPAAFGGHGAGQNRRATTPMIQLRVRSRNSPGNVVAQWDFTPRHLPHPQHAPQALFAFPVRRAVPPQDAPPGDLAVLRRLHPGCFAGGVTNGHQVHLPTFPLSDLTFENCFGSRTVELSPFVLVGFPNMNFGFAIPYRAAARFQDSQIVLKNLIFNLYLGFQIVIGIKGHDGSPIDFCNIDSKPATDFGGGRHQAISPYCSLSQRRSRMRSSSRLSAPSQRAARSTAITAAMRTSGARRSATCRCCAGTATRRSRHRYAPGAIQCRATRSAAIGLTAALAAA